MSKDRADLGFAAELDSFDPSDWEETSTNKKTRPGDVKAAAEASGFMSREANSTAQPKQPRRRRTTGRNQQLNIKARAETIKSFYSVADSNGWGLGETLEYAVELLKENFGRKN